MTQVQFGWWLPVGPQNGLLRKNFLTTVREGIELVTGHFAAIWFVDHLQDPTPLLEGWTALTYLSALCSPLDFGHAVLSQSFRNPALLAKMATTAQFMSEGRFIFGIGAGWKEEEYKSYGYDFPKARVRIEELEEALQIITALWQGERVTYYGEHYRVVDAICIPKPDPIPPIVIGGMGPRMLRLVARYADWWNVSSMPLERYQQKVKDCERACQAIQRDPATLRRTWFGECLCLPTEKEALNRAHLPGDGAFVGTAAQIVKQMRPLVSLGVDYFILNCGDFPDLTTLNILINEVLPALNS